MTEQSLFIFSFSIYAFLLVIIYSLYAVSIFDMITCTIACFDWKEPQPKADLDDLEILNNI